MDAYEQSPHYSKAMNSFEDAIDKQTKGAWMEFAKDLADVFTVAWCEGASETLKAAGVGYTLPKKPSVASCKKTVQMSSDEWERLTHSSLDAAVEVAAYEAGVTADMDDSVAESRKIVVVRTNASRAFHQGQQHAAVIESVMARVPLYKYTARMDDRTRPTHRQMNGYYASPIDIESKSLATPCGFNCRCRWKPVPMATARRLGFIGARGAVLKSALAKWNGSRQSLLNSRLFPDPGFGAT